LGNWKTKGLKLGYDGCMELLERVDNL